MPGHIYGIGTSYWGKQNVVTIHDHCQTCGRYVKHITYETWYCLSVFFIPVLPVKRKKIIDQCEVITKNEKITKSIKLIASGGISTFDELPKLAKLGCEGTIIGKAIYENRITLKQLEQFILTTKI